MAKLHDKFAEALGSDFLTSKHMMPWNLVEITSGWPLSVYLLEPTNWCLRDIETLRAAVDSVVMKKADWTVRDLPSAEQLHSQLVNECKRLNLFKHGDRVIHWRRIAANTDNLRLTSTHVGKWNTQDRKMIQRLVQSMNLIKDGSVMLECAPFYKYSDKIFIEGRKERPEPFENNNQQSQKNRITKSTIKKKSETNVTESESSVENEADINRADESGESCTDILDTLSEDFPEALANAVPKHPILLPSLKRSPSELLFSQSMDILSGAFEDSQLESILSNEFP